jgi:HEAT repeat protein
MRLRAGEPMSRSVDDQLAQLESLKRQPLSDDTIAQLAKGLSGKSNVIAAKAASVAAALKAAALAGALGEALRRFIDGNDKGCLAKTAIVKALAAMESGDEDVLLVAARHVQMEPVWGGSSDVAVDLRCEAVMELVRRNSRRMWEPLVRLFADPAPSARSIAARSLAATGQDPAKYLLQYKLLVGDKEPAVLAECFTGVLMLTRSVELVAPFLDSPNPDLRESAVLALGESRLPDAFPLLRDHHHLGMPADEEKLLLLSIAMTRQPTAVDYLIELLSRPNRNPDLTLEALSMYRNDPAIRARIDEALRARKQP